MNFQKLVARNFYMRFSRFQDDYEFRNCDMINNFDKIGTLEDLKSLEYIDVHGQSCNLRYRFGYISGLTDLTSFPLENGNLKYINVSNTNLTYINLEILKVRKFEFILNETPWDKKTGVNMSKSSCQFMLGKNSPNYSMCDVLK